MLKTRRILFQRGLGPGDWRMGFHHIKDPAFIFFSEVSDPASIGGWGFRLFFQRALGPGAYFFSELSHPAIIRGAYWRKYDIFF